MADVSVQVLTPATNFDLLSLDEAKILLGIPGTDTSGDEQLAMLISVYSATVAEMCNRTFARETVRETWRDVFDGRLFLTHWPVKVADIESVMSAGWSWPPDEYELEEKSGKLSNVRVHEPSSSPWAQSVIVTYTGGYVLPDEAPPPLKQATAILIREERTKAQQASVVGIRQIMHKESRIAFFDTQAAAAKTGGGGGSSSAVQQAAVSLLTNYMRFWV